MSDIDFELKRLFDERLERYRAAPHARGKQMLRPALGAALALLVFGGAGLALDANQVAAVNGVSCPDVFATVKLWAQAKATDPTSAPSKPEMAAFVERSGCTYIRKTSTDAAPGKVDAAGKTDVNKALPTVTK